MLMSETVEKKKKIYKLATELNISHETLIEFLRKKGHEVKSHMSSVDDDMMRDVLVHFKKEKDVAEKHQRKIQEIRDSRKKAEKKEEAIVEPPVAAHPVAAHTVTAPSVAGAPVAEAPDEEHEVAEAPSAEPTAEVAAAAQDVPGAHLAPEPAAGQHEVPIAPVPIGESAPVEPAAKPAPVAPPKKEEVHHLSPLEKERRAKIGLTIKGKIDLRPKQAPPKPAKPTAPVAGAATSAAADLDDAHKRKKKKKKVKEDVPEVKVAEPEEGERKKKKKKKLRHKEVDQHEVQDAIRRTFAAMDDTAVSVRASFKKRKRKEREEEEARAQEEALKQEGKLRVTEFVSVNDLANLMKVNVADVIKKCMELGIMVSINQRLDKDTIMIVADEFGFEITFYSELTE